MEGTLWSEGGSETAWRAYGMGVDVYSRDEGDVGGKEARGGRQVEANMKRTEGI